MFYLYNATINLVSDVYCNSRSGSTNYCKVNTIFPKSTFILKDLEINSTDYIIFKWSWDIQYALKLGEPMTVSS